MLLSRNKTIRLQGFPGNPCIIKLLQQIRGNYGINPPRLLNRTESFCQQHHNCEPLQLWKIIRSFRCLLKSFTVATFIRTPERSEGVLINFFAVASTMILFTYTRNPEKRHFLKMLISQARNNLF